jgi:hypothetical protein
MGTKCAPTYANLVLSIIEEEFLNTLTLKPSLRFIDDIFLVYNHGSQNLIEMVDQFNSTQSLELTLEWSTTELAFLDTCLSTG